jgi:hypothetical protein
MIIMIIILLKSGWQVGAGYQVDFPVANTSRCIVTPSTNVPDLLAANPYSFAFWSYYPVLQKRVLQAASLVNLAGTYASLSHVLTAYLPTDLSFLFFLSVFA